MQKSARIYVLLVCQIVWLNIGYAQLHAKFQLSTHTGCPPFLQVQAINQTTGATGATIYSWNFGNGKVSAIIDTVYTTYLSAGVYVVKLTAKNSSTDSSVYTDTVKIYNNPMADFSFSNGKGCVPTTVNFTQNAKDDEGIITNYLWDFGDGQTSTQANPTHTYKYGINPAVMLYVSNNYGCQGVISKSGVSVLPYPVASFSVLDTFVCSIGSVVNFINKTDYDSSSFGSLNYSWDFGDGNTSVETNPSHIYTSKGTYSVKLTAVNSAGCQSDTIKTNYITVANFSTAIKCDTVTCVNSVDTIKDISNTNATIRNWYIDNNYVSGSQLFNYIFSSGGNHTIKLMNQYNTCVDSAVKNVFVNPPLNVGNFQIAILGNCGSPVDVQLADTGNYANGKRVWTIVAPSGITTTFEDAKTVLYTAMESGTHSVTLSVTDTVLGCINSVQNSFIISKPIVTVSHISTSSSCIPVAIGYGTNISPSTDSITSYNWNFNDTISGTNNTSTLVNPVHTFNKAGTYAVQLVYTTLSGCIDSVIDKQPVIAYNKPKSIFKALNAEICGNNPVGFKDSSVGPPTQWYWNFGDSKNNPQYFSTEQNPTHSYTDSGFYTVSLIVTYQSCSDTSIQKNIVHILPDFPVGMVAHNCINRNNITFINDSYYVDSLVWDLGDGSTPKTISPVSLKTFPYSYSTTGTYTTILAGYARATPLIDASIKNCVVTIPVTVNVLNKQAPKLSLLSSSCSATGGIGFKISGLEHNPSVASGSSSYSITKFQFNDGTTFSGMYNLANSVIDTAVTGTFTSGFTGHDSIRAILQSANLSCYDTTNFLEIDKVMVANFSISNRNICYKQNPVYFTDISTPRKNIPIKKWIWDFGDGNMVTITNKSKGDTFHTYTDLAYFYPQLTVVDSLGCTTMTTPGSFKYAVFVDGPKADFTFLPASGIIPNTSVSFQNTTNTIPGYPVNYTWYSQKWGTTTNFTPNSYIYGNASPDTVTLIASSSGTLCQNDTVTKIIPVEAIKVAFTDSTYYLYQSNCPPLVITFKNNSVNANNIKWSFGDGSYSYLNEPQHVYNSAGDYKIVLYAYGNNGYVDSAYDSVHVLGPLGTINSNAVSGVICSPATVQFTGHSNAASYSWDFGDGSSPVASTDTSILYTYTKSGKYLPGLIMKDAVGCMYEKVSDFTVIVDTLHVDITHSPLVVCDSGYINFTPSVYSLSQQYLLQEPAYQWQFLSGSKTDTSTQITPQFYSNVTGVSYAKLHASTTSGCNVDAIDSIIIHPAYKGSIIGDSDICYNTLVQYAATPPSGSSVSWLWNFNNGNTDAGYVPVMQKFVDTTSDYTHNISLNVVMDGCSSTVNKLIWVHAPPSNIFSTTYPQNHLCLNDSIRLLANNGVKYLWQPALYMNNDTVSNPKVSPPIDTKYKVTATNRYGCFAIDSTHIQVIQPIKIALTPDTFICKNDNVQLSVNGANTYLWDASSFINNVNISNPTVNPLTPTTFKVKGYSLYNCFVDSGQVFVDVKDLPSIYFATAVNDSIQVVAGGNVTLYPTYSSDVVSYLWTPNNNLNCNTCPYPVASPNNDITYHVKALNKYQCAATGSVTVALTCAAGKISIPTAFTPNNDGLNDRFYVMGHGLKQVNYFRIFDRSGNLVFEKYNCALNDATSGWDGKYKGTQANVGTYVYEVQVQCDAGTVFNYRGTVVLIR